MLILSKVRRSNSYLIARNMDIGFVMKEEIYHESLFACHRQAQGVQPR